MQAEIAQVLDEHHTEQLLHYHKTQNFVDQVSREQAVYQKKPGDKREKQADFTIVRVKAKFNRDKSKEEVEKDIENATSYAVKQDVLPARIHVVAISISKFGFEEMSKIFQHMPMIIARYRDCGTPVRLWMQAFNYSIDGEAHNDRQVPVGSAPGGWGNGDGLRTQSRVPEHEAQGVCGKEESGSS
ncbi:uncharacterized protein Z519_06327 [Cladophialophora bantiana CBS 173.52]|uniref:THUMP domain-containing protein n=1 Tax=Cladophialophora bantiana (strain ATCC 10958 / CBS 173.52 / CDC B-1940 / NIH 8579) TaxID=1442370 RepID=A0A0D2HNR9_CLAB1|nr:uncharacterized protein Z519_06327 [Cladophialophora bantiana CBS 173.52]KIW92480.1 hypothetical protein Z519_06327 [Cladophialophora bantiana CBS 173.52]